MLQSLSWSCEIKKKTKNEEAAVRGEQRPLDHRNGINTQLSWVESFTNKHNSVLVSTCWDTDPNLLFKQSCVFVVVVVSVRDTYTLSLAHLMEVGPPTDDDYLGIAWIAQVCCQLPLS